MYIFWSLLVIWGCAFPSHAGAADTYQYFLTEGQKALERHDEQEAVRYFRWAHRVDPTAEEPMVYLRSVPDGQSVLEDGVSDAGPSLSYEEYMEKGTSALEQQDRYTALEYFYKARLVDPAAEAPVEYINLIKRMIDERVVHVKPKMVGQSLDQVKRSVPSAPEAEPPAFTAPAVSPRRMLTEASTAVVPVQTVERSYAPVPALPVPVARSYIQPAKKRVEDIIAIADIVKNAAPRPTLRLEMGRTVILEGKNIQKFLVVSEDFIQINRISADRLQISGQRRGSTFLHVWDDAGRATIYIEILFPDSSGELAAGHPLPLEHAAPFRFNYANDWSGYYNAPQGSTMKRRSLTFEEDVGMLGETPYGYLDSSATLTGFNPVRGIPTYTTGLSGIPVPGTSALNVRVFDATRLTSPLTMPGAHLRGAFLDVRTFQDAVGLSVSHGQLQPIFGYSNTSSGSQQSYVDAFQVVLFPKDPENHYAFNYARGYGSARNPTLTKQVYSLEGTHRIDKVLLNAELARSGTHAASLGGLGWSGNGWNSALHVRDINKNFTTITSPPSGQGETGAMWTGNMNPGTFSADAMVDVYRQKLYFNPDHPDALNLDTDANIRVPLNPALSLDNQLRYVDTAGELSPRRTMSVDSRLTRDFEAWGGRHGAVYAGGAYQNSRYPGSSISNYDRYDVLTGVNLPLTRDTSWFANYQYSWLIEGVSNNLINPSSFGTGLSCNKELREHLTGNLSLSYRYEQNAGGLNSFLAGEDSLGTSGGLSYNPTSDLSYFLDTNVRQVWSHVDSHMSYTDMDLRMGMRGAWAVPLAWDPVGAVTGIVYKDKNGNGRKDPGEKGMPDIKVRAGERDAVTDKDGKYRIEVRGKRVLVTPVMETMPAGFVFSTPSFFRVDILQGMAQRVDFGLTTQSGIYGVAFVDKNGNGVPDQGDQFLPRVKVTLDGRQTVASDAQGAYFFKKVAEGGHTLTIDMKSLPVNLIPVLKIKNDIVVTEGVTYVFHIPMRLKESAPVKAPQRSE